MKMIASILVLLIPLSISAQNTDSNCLRMIHQADSLAQKKDFKRAINKYTAAATCDSKLQQLVNAKINAVFDLVEKEKQLAIKNEKEAKKQTLIAKEQLRKSKALYFASEAWNIKEIDPTQSLRLIEAADSLYPNLPSVMEKIIPIYRMIDTIRCYKKSLKHRGGVNYAVFSKDGYRLLTASKDSLARLWDKEGNLKAVLQHKNNVTIAHFSPEEHYILTASTDSTAKVWDKQGNFITSVFHGSIIWDAFFSPDEKMFLTYGPSDTIYLWDTNGSKLTNLIHKEQVKSCVFFQSKDSTLILTASEDDTARLWDKNGHIVTVFPQHDDIVNAFFSPNRKMVLTCSDDSTAGLWHLNGVLIVKLKHKGYVIDGLFTKDSKKILTYANDKTIRIWDTTGHQIDSMIIPNYIRDAIFSPDESLVLVMADSTVFVWNLIKKQMIPLLHNDLVHKIKFSPNGQYILTVWGDLLTEGEGRVALWNLKGEKLAIFNHPGYVKGAVFSPDSKVILSGWGNMLNDYTGGAFLWNIKPDLFPEKEFSNIKLPKKLPEKGEKTLQFVKEMDKVQRSGIESWSDFHIAAASYDIYFSPSGENIVSTNNDSTITWWDKYLQPTMILPHKNQVSKICFSSNEYLIAVGFFDGLVQILGKNSKSIFKHKYKKAISALSFSPDNQFILIATIDSTLNIIQLNKPNISNRSLHLESVVKHISFIPHSHIYAVTTENNSAYLYSYNSSKPLKKFISDHNLDEIKYSFDGHILLKTANPIILSKRYENISTLYHDNWVNSAAFAIHSPMIVTAVSDPGDKKQTIRLWSLDGLRLVTYSYSSFGLQAQFLHDDNEIIAFYANERVKIWATPKGILNWLKQAPLEGLEEKWVTQIPENN